MINHDQFPVPDIVTPPEVSLVTDIDAVVISQTMTELRTSPEKIAATTILVDDTNRMLNKGMTFPRWIGRMRYFANPRLRRANGPIVRVSSVLRGVERTDEDMNGTLVHELEHIAQEDRHDPNMILGLVAIWGLSAAGGIVGNRLSRGRRPSARIAATLAGAAMGYQIGYQLAPHEIQARRRAKTVRMSAIKRK